MQLFFYGLLSFGELRGFRNPARGYYLTGAGVAGESEGPLCVALGFTLRACRTLLLLVDFNCLGLIFLQVDDYTPAFG